MRVRRDRLAAYPVVGVKAVLYDGSYHPVDSSEMAFKTGNDPGVQERLYGCISCTP